jgi:membrane protease subunit (stomatin/prohibitin family)
MPIRQVISTIDNEGVDIMNPTILAYHYPDSTIVSGSLLTVESNHFAVLKSRGAILNKFSTGQYTIQTPDKPIIGSIQQGWFGGQSPWQYEIIYVNRAKLILSIVGAAMSKEMATLKYHVSAYIHVDTEDDAIKLVQHMPFIGHTIKVDEVATYSAPVVEQAINQIVQLTPLEQINEKMSAIMEIITEHLTEHFSVYGIHLNDIKATVQPADERMIEIISFQALGLKPHEAVKAWLATEAIKHNLVSAPNLMSGEGFVIGAPQMASLAGVSMAGKV